MGGYLNHNKKNYSERRNHGLSLTNLTHCISPSEYYNDYYNNDSFNKINLQLHASSKVSNPYSFSIKSNTSFGASIEPDVPTETAYLYRDIYPEDKNRPNILTMPITIPAGVKVIKFALGGNASQYDEPCSCEAINTITGKTWAASSGDGAVGTVVYIGVTPGKRYNIKYSVYSEIDLVDYSCLIAYSKQINTYTPNITDY